MDSADTGPTPKNGGNGALFPATHWTEIAAIRDNRHPEADVALENLCRTYLPAIENYMRWFRRLPGDPHELANEFLAQFIHQDSLSRVDRTKGKFRSYVAGAIRYFLLNKWRGVANAPPHVEYDETMDTPTTHGDFDGEFDRSFARILVSNAIAQTVQRFVGSRLEPQLPALLPYLAGLSQLDLENLRNTRKPAGRRKKSSLQIRGRLTPPDRRRP